MEVFLVLLVITLVFGMSLAGHYVDNKYNLQLVKWLNCEVSSPFKASTFRQKNISSAQSDRDELRERIENLEKIVTEPSYELNKKINEL